MTADGEIEATGDVRDDIARLEAHIEELADTIEGCRKLVLLAKAALAGGTLAMLAMLFGAIRDDALVLAAAMAALMGGIVVLGSNLSTAKQALARMQDAEVRRAALIDRLDLRDLPPVA
jgi:hypothetical protein